MIPAPVIRRIRKGFTLIELLVVMAISAILLSLIIIPLVQSFNMTRMAEAFSNAQSRARIITERIALEIGNATSARATSGLVLTSVNGVGTKVPQHALIAQLPGKSGGFVDVVLPYSKIDLVRPAEGDPVRGPNGGYIDPVTGMEDPTLTAPKGQVSLPVAPGMTIVRYFIGLRDPFRNYNNPYDGLLMARNAQQDNLYVLYRAEVQPIVSGGAANEVYFEKDAVTGGPVMDDPRFFVPNRDVNGKPILNDAKAERIKNWMGLGSGGTTPTGIPLGANTQVAANSTNRAIVQTEVSRYDMVQVGYDLRTREATYDGNVPRVVPLIQFAPAHVSNDPAEGQLATRQGEESDNSVTVAPDVYSTKFGLWDRAIIRDWPRGWNPNDANANEYNVARGDITSGDGNGFPSGVSIYAYDPDSAPNDFDAGVETFDLTLYERLVAGGGRYPFSQAANAANARSGWFDIPRARNTFVPFTYRSGSGKVLTSFGINEVGLNPATVPPSNNPQNLPAKATSNSDGPTTPLTDDYTGGNFWDVDHDPINEKFNWVWANRKEMQPDVHRFIDLRVTTNADGAVSPLHPTLGFSRAVIVPGSEEVYGPDQLPGPNYGFTIRYTRTTARNPGPNQYRINYVDQPEPTNEAGAVDYSTVNGVRSTDMAGFNPNVYNDKNFISAIIQPRFKKGYLELNSDPNVALPAGDIMVSYRFQFNAAGNRGNGSREDVFAVEYDTRQLIDVLLTIRNYPQSQSTPNPQTITLKSTATVRNYIR
jgi:prepilin-type N-terminal cleavage/methylation domain-containing protein